MKKEDYKKAMIEALKDFNKAYDRLVELFNDCDNEVNDYICNDYPFEMSFDEININDWVLSTIENLEKKED